MTPRLPGAQPPSGISFRLPSAELDSPQLKLAGLGLEPLPPAAAERFLRAIVRGLNRSTFGELRLGMEINDLDESLAEMNGSECPCQQTQKKPKTD